MHVATWPRLTAKALHSVMRKMHLNNECDMQVVGDGKGVVKAFGERECSVQRRLQKVVEESPSPFVDEELRSALCTAAENLCAAASYRSAGTLPPLFLHAC